VLAFESAVLLFASTAKDVDHLITPEERLHIAMARQ
jgi:hypothetical protein